MKALSHSAKVALVVLGILGIGLYLFYSRKPHVVSTANTEGMSNIAMSSHGPDATEAVHGSPGSVGGDLKPSELLPSGGLGAAWAATNPVGLGDLQGQNLLSAGALIGKDTVGQSKRNASFDLRTEPHVPRSNVGPWQQSVKEGPDVYRRGLGDIGLAAANSVAASA